jgi:hypothetical protein
MKGANIMPEKRKIPRRDFTYYMPVMDALTKQLVGYLTDISTGGFRLDSLKQIPPQADLQLQIQLTPDIATKEFMVFVARSKWCQQDRIDPNTFNVGFQIINMSPTDLSIFQRMCEKYGSQKPAKTKNYNDYLWR